MRVRKFIHILFYSHSDPHVIDGIGHALSADERGASLLYVCVFAKARLDSCPTAFDSGFFALGEQAEIWYT